MEIDLLFVPGCSSRGKTEELIKRLLDELAPQARFKVKEVSSQKKAEALKFPGSPTIRVNGNDIEPDADKKANFGLS